MALVLKVNHNQDAIACSWKWNPLESRTVLYDWADYIIIMQDIFIDHVPERFRAKTKCVEVGPDIWGSPMHKELCEGLLKVADSWAARNWDL